MTGRSIAPLTLLLAASCVGNANVGVGTGASLAMVREIDSAVAELASPDPEAATRAARRIITFGEPAIPYLLRLRGDRRPFAGGNNLVNPLASSLVPTAVPPGTEPGVMQPTMEIVAIYLVCGITKGRLEIASSLGLIDLRIPAEQRQPQMTGDIVERAWRVLTKWDEARPHGEPPVVSPSQQDPLEADGLAFW